jgi:diketogulonate reductase-like aldo/keto reductase
MSRERDDLPPVTRREALHTLAAIGAGAMLGAQRLGAQAPALNLRTIPKSGEKLPVLGLGSWITFNVGDDPDALKNCAQVVSHFAARGGRLIDSSPMYGSSQATIGYALRTLHDRAAIFSADKVWTSSASAAAAQIAETERRWGVAKLDLLEVHNLEGWEVHLPKLFAMKAAGQLRYVGVTTSHGRRMDDAEKLVRTQPLDFVQFTYNILDREPEQRLLPLAQERGIAVICNRPFREGELIQELKGRPLPPWAAEIGAPTWPRFLLKYIASHPAVTCAIPATSQVAHVEENMDAAYGPLPDPATRKRMAAYVDSLS